MNGAVRRTAAMVCVASLPFAVGCGAMFGGTKQVIRVASTPDGAAVNTSPQTLEVRTPASLNLERKQEYLLTFSMPGYTSQQVQLKRSMRGGILALDIASCCLSVVIDAVTGGWYKLSPNPASVTLTKLGASAGPDTIVVTVDAKATKGAPGVRVASTVPGVRISVRPHHASRAHRGASAND